MALSANTVWEVRAAGAFNNGGGFVTGASGTDFSQQDSAQYALTGATSAGADAIILHASAASNMVGNLAHVISGTNATAGFYEIISVVVGVSITVDRNWGTGAVASGVVNIGGATNLNSASITQMTAAAVAGNTVWIKAGNHTLGGALSFTNGSATARIKIQGYLSTRGDAPRGSNRPAISLGSNAIQPGNNNILMHVDTTGTGSRNITGGTAVQLFNVKATNSGANRAILHVDNMTIIDCEASCTGGGAAVEIQNGHFFMWGCYLHDSTTGAAVSNTSSQAAIQNCLFARNTTAINVSASMTGTGSFVQNTIYGTTGVSGTGISFASGCTGCFVVLNNIFKNLTTAITHGSASNVIGHSDWNNFHGNTTARTNWPTGANDFTTDPGFRDAANSDFRVGANGKATALSSSASCSTSVGYMDPGAVQRLEDYPAAASVLSGVVYSNTETTGTYTAPTAASIADAVWDELLADHTTASTFGAQVGGKLLTVAKFLGLK